jgi:hypothetical protein
MKLPFEFCGDEPDLVHDEFVLRLDDGQCIFVLHIFEGKLVSLAKHKTAKRIGLRPGYRLPKNRLKTQKEQRR